MNPIIDFFEVQPFTKINGDILLTDWFPISDTRKIPELKKLGYKINIQQTHVRNEYLLRNKGKV